MIDRWNDLQTYNASEARDADYAERQERFGRFAPLPDKRFEREALRGRFALTDTRTGERRVFDLSSGGEIDAWLWKWDQTDKEPRS